MCPKLFSQIYKSLHLFFFFKQRFNADYELTARQGADTMAYIALLEEKLRPALVSLSFCRFPDNMWS